MADGVDINTNGNPWTITFHSGAGTALPATVVGVQHTGNQAYPVLLRRIRWVSVAAKAGDRVIVKDLPGVGGTGTQRAVIDMVATGADFEVDESRPAGKELFVGMQITQMDSGVLYLFI